MYRGFGNCATFSTSRPTSWWYIFWYFEFQLFLKAIFVLAARKYNTVVGQPGFLNISLRQVKKTHPSLSCFAAILLDKALLELRTLIAVSSWGLVLRAWGHCYWKGWKNQTWGFFGKISSVVLVVVFKPHGNKCTTCIDTHITITYIHNISIIIYILSEFSENAGEGIFWWKPLCFWISGVWPVLSSLALSYSAIPHVEPSGLQLEFSCPLQVDFFNVWDSWTHLTLCNKKNCTNRKGGKHDKVLAKLSWDFPSLLRVLQDVALWSLQNVKDLVPQHMVASCVCFQ